MRRLGGTVVLLLLSCTPDPAPPKPARVHPEFPITEGAHKDFKCVSCHPITVTNYAQFECTGCHGEAATAPRHPAVNGYVWASGACYGCHRDGKAPNAPNISPNVHDPSQNVLVTGLVPTFSGTTIVPPLTPLEQSIPMRMNHASTQIPSAALSACTNCHFSADQGSLFPGHFHSALLGLKLAQPKLCADCHAGATPEGFVGPDAGPPDRFPPSGAMRHDAVALDGGAPLVNQDCSLCHVPPTASSAASWSTLARFHAAVNPQPSSCVGCHANERPGVISYLDAGLPPKIAFNHRGELWLDDCNACHASTTEWTNGKFHRPNVAPPATCLPCHAADRPTGADPTPTAAPFDFGTNDAGITHGAGQDCAVCHTAGAFAGGVFAHDAGALSGTTCVACHSTQRPTAPVNGFDHALSGTGDCFGCHQATSKHAKYPDDWAGGQSYPGANLIASSDRFIQVNQIALNRNGAGLVTGTTTTLVTLYNAMLHTSLALPPDAGLAPGPAPGLTTTCWHCHTSIPGTTTVTAFRDGKFHASLGSYKVDPMVGVTPLPQPTEGCTDCHAGMRPKHIVQKSTLQPMDHGARFTDGGSVSLLDCSVCHSSPGGTWNTGTFHENVAFADQQNLEDCVTCHFTLMADAPKVDVVSTATPSYRMQHRSGQLTFQQCDRCHPSALGNAQLGGTGAGLWAPGKFHQNLPTGKQPTACLECHGTVTTPNHPTQSAFLYEGSPQWMNHQVATVAAKDCAFCHQATASSNQWRKDTLLHRPGLAVSECKGCHAATYQGLPSNVPMGLEETDVITSASPATGVSGQKLQIAHTDVNVSGKDCGFCHTAPAAMDGGWSGATFHSHYQGANALQLNGTTGRCSNCHLNVKPVPSYPAQNHSAFTATSATDCSACHLWPGTGTAAMPNWKRASGPPASITVGGFAIASPPAANATTLQAGLNNLAHPAVPTGTQCTACHTQAGGGRQAFGYDHALAPATGCAACHEAGSDLVGKPWVNNAPGANSASAVCGMGGGMILDRGGDTRPIGIPAIACSSNAKNLTCGGQNCSLNHFFPADCGECHVKPSQLTPAVNTTGPSFVQAWKFTHYFGAPAQQATCCKCHAPPSCRP